MKYLVLGGGISPEHDVSLRSAQSVANALTHGGNTVDQLDPSTVTPSQLVEIAAQYDGVFPILHGEGGEDGSIQSLLEKQAIPFFGPSTTSCEATFDKVHFKEILAQNNIASPKGATVTAATLASEPLTQTPFVLKPITGGSSIDTFIVRSIPFDEAPLIEALHRYGSMLIEELVEGVEITVGVLDAQALPVIEIIPPQDKEFDYENKYNGATQELCPPAHVSKELQEKAQQIALEVHAVTHCRHLSRTDMMISNAGELYVIDTNTIPGMTNQSLFPKAAAEAGYSWEELVAKFASMI